VEDLVLLAAARRRCMWSSNNVVVVNGAVAADVAGPKYHDGAVRTRREVAGMNSPAAAPVPYRCHTE